MSTFIRIGCLTALVVLFFAPGLTSANECVIKEGLVFCGSKDCRTTSDGKVACGGLAKECRTTSKGEVACGGQWKSF